MTVDTSPDSKCPICLDRFDNVAYLDNCWHRFYFRCVQDRAKTKAECPLCKLPFIAIFHTICADNDFKEYRVTPSAEAASSSHVGSTITFAQNPLNLHIYDLPDSYNYLTPPHDEGSGSNSADPVDTLVTKHSSSVSAVGQSPWDDESPGPSSSTLEERGATTAPQQELPGSSDKKPTWKRIKLRLRLQAGVDYSDSDSSAEYQDISGYADRTPELTEPSSDSEEFIEKKRKHMKKEQSVQRLSKKRKTRSLQDFPQNSDSSHGHEPCRKRHSEHHRKKKRSRSRDGSKHRDKKSRRDSSRSLAHHKGHGQRRPSSQDSDHHYGGGCGYEHDYPSCSQKTARDSPSCRKRTHAEAHSSKKPAGPEFGIQPFAESTDLPSQMGLHEGDDSHYRQCRSRSQSSSRSGSPSRETNRISEKPGGKRKCKTRYLENTDKGSTSMEETRILKKIISASRDWYKYTGSPSDNQASSEAEPKKKKKKKKKRRSPSVESP